MGKNYLTNELDHIQWTENLPSGCDVELEVCVADDYADFENYISPPAFFGPTGGGNFTTPAGQALPSGKTGRYAMVRATLTGNGTDTPSLSDIQLTCNAGSDTGSRTIRTQYDEAGNILRITTIDDLGVSEDVRDDAGWSAPDRINTLNQIMRQDVGGDTWTFSYDGNGNMTGKTNGVDTWTYTWNDENRLIRVQGPGSVDVTYAYDKIGRMMSRDDGSDLTNFLWDEFDCIREQTGMSTTTYCIPEGVLTSFIRDGDRFDVHTDHVMSVRMVTDENGDVVLRREYAAWGGELAGNFDNVPGGFHYGFVGGLGCRQDPTAGLVYMRARWFDPQLQRFISRDPIGLNGGSNLYAYAGNNPTTGVDPSGLEYRKVAEGDMYQETREWGGLWRKTFKLHWEVWYDDCSGTANLYTKVTNLTMIKQKIDVDFDIYKGTRGSWSSTKGEFIHPKRGRMTFETRTSPLPADIRGAHISRPLELSPGETESAGASNLPIGVNADAVSGGINVHVPQYSEDIPTGQGGNMHHTVTNSNFGIRGTFMFGQEVQPAASIYGQRH